MRVIDTRLMQALFLKCCNIIFSLFHKLWANTISGIPDPIAATHEKIPACGYPIIRRPGLFCSQTFNRVANRSFDCLVTHSH